MPYPTLRALKTYIGKCPVCLVACLGVKEGELETRLTDAMVSGTGPGLGQHRICDTNSQVHVFFVKTSRTRDILGILQYIYVKLEIFEYKYVNISVMFILIG